MAVSRKPLDYNPWEVLERCNEYTPDFQDLNRCNTDEFIIFVTGNLRRAHAQNHLLEGANWYGKGISWKDDFIMKTLEYEPGFGSRPEPLLFQLPKKDRSLWRDINHVFSENDLRAVEGDIYGVPLRLLTKIDKHEGNTQGVNRELHFVDFDQQAKGKHVKAWMYTVDINFYMDQALYGDRSENASRIRYPSGLEAYYF